tara:strand:+ start:3468 stop:3887 length:420 start_codon:yes stop_codon:yes gene_type:complete
MSDWDTTPVPINNSSPALIAAVDEYQRVTETLESLKETHEGLLETIAAEFPIMSGEQAIDVAGMTVTCTRLERWTWDNDLLEDLFMSQDDLPDHIKKRLTVNKKLFTFLDDEQKKALMPALTRTPGPARVKVIKVSADV